MAQVTAAILLSASAVQTIRPQNELAVLDLLQPSVPSDLPGFLAFPVSIPPDPLGVFASLLISGVSEASKKLESLIGFTTQPSTTLTTVPATGALRPTASSLAASSAPSSSLPSSSSSPQRLSPPQPTVAPAAPPLLAPLPPPSSTTTIIITQHSQQPASVPTQPKAAEPTTVAASQSSAVPLLGPIATETMATATTEAAASTAVPMNTSPAPIGLIPPLATAPIGSLQPQAATVGGAETIDPANGDFLGGSPNREVDLPVTIVFLIIFLAGAFTHISIYRANAKRGHKFLLSDLMFDFCMIRSVTCIFRIIWVFIPVRGVILASLIFMNGGAAVILAVNVFFTQRLVRSLHPKVGWSRWFSILSAGLTISVPVIIFFNITNTIVFFFSVGDVDRLDTMESLLKFGGTWVLWLAIFPLIALLIATGVPGPRPEQFGTGDWRVKKSILLFSALVLAPGAAVRLAATASPAAPEAASPLFGKTIFYTTQFMLEVFVVALYAAARVDLLFHVPDGSSRPGDYSGRNGRGGAGAGGPLVTRADVEEAIETLGLPYEIFGTKAAPGDGREVLFAMLYADRPGTTPPARPDRGTALTALEFEKGGLGFQAGGSDDADGFHDVGGGVSSRSGDGAEDSNAPLPPRIVSRVSRRQSLLEALRPLQRRMSPRSVVRPSYVGPPPPLPRSDYQPGDRDDYIGSEEESRNLQRETIPVYYTDTRPTH